MEAKDKPKRKRVNLSIEQKIEILEKLDRASSCKKGEFLCDNGHCVDQIVVCDGGNNCWDRSDERNCSPCFDGSFRCWDPVHSDNCYLDTERCDGHFHCKQGADEKGCGACDPDQFACEITQADASHCYDSSQLCDGRIDCNKNQADESNPLCQSNYQKCPTGLYSCLLKDSEGTQCYDAVRRCDGIADCRPSASDETGCSHKCDHFCKDTFQCWNETNRCDGKYFCPDFSDEEGCGLCLFDQFLCRNSNKCFHRSDMCNGIRDCWDGFDEMYCSKDTCGGIDQLYPAAERCNGRVFCTSGEDEKGCGPCRPDQFTCGGSELTTLCYDQHQRCNEHADCPSPSVDEMNCVFSSDSHVVGSDHPRTGPTAINLPQKAFSSKAIIAIISMLLAVTVICTLIAGLCLKRRRRRRRQQYTTERSSVSTNDLLPPPYSETDVGNVYFNNRLQIQDRLTFIGFPSSENDDDLPSYEESLLLADTNTMINGTHDGQAVNEAQDDYLLPSEQEIDHTNDEEGNPVDRLL
ncbi:low-density lipoprotein receptor-related protein 1B-like isoform X3 [Corticium candelabrum]|uniref:low-density lipoprotein receptor-related protein 1B-like isoform X3 n=1 Tax=Corticium candelabrum TaxID=121492 RepID=UPI002E2539C6|nr:low-density lipoprotein receptor-related protein 1B-like isoform X3 [Corticium candelabrum]